MDQQPDHDDASNSGRLVARVNIVDEDAPDDAADWTAEPVSETLRTDATANNAPPSRAPMSQVIPLGLLALAIVAISMFVILSGVFEMIPD